MHVLKCGKKTGTVLWKNVVEVAVDNEDVSEMTEKKLKDMRTNT